MPSEDTLVEMERRFWLAEETFYEDNLADEVVVLVPGMILDREGTVRSIAGGARWETVHFEDVHAVELGEDAAAIAYRVTAERADEDLGYVALISSVYVRRDGTWRLAMHQQTPLTEA